MVTSDFSKKSKLGQDVHTNFRMGKVSLMADPGAGAPAVVRDCGHPSSGLRGPTDPLRSNETSLYEPIAKG